MHHGHPYGLVNRLGGQRAREVSLLTGSAVTGLSQCRGVGKGTWSFK